LEEDEGGLVKEGQSGRKNETTNENRQGRIDVVDKLPTIKVFLSKIFSEPNNSG